jgi:hypothetical protein
MASYAGSAKTDSVSDGRGSAAERVDLHRLWWVGLIAAGVVLMANGVLRLVARGPLDVSAAFEPLEWGMIVGASIVGVLGATILLALLARFSRRPIRLFWITAGVVLLLSLGGPLSANSEPGGTATAVTVLIAMHLVTAAIAGGLLTTLARERSR